MEAEERFKEVQNAYEVLSDKHERAWCVLLKESCNVSVTVHCNCSGLIILLIILIGWASSFMTPCGLPCAQPGS